MLSEHLCMIYCVEIYIFSLEVYPGGEVMDHIVSMHLGD